MKVNNRTAGIAGILYLIIIASGIFAQFFVRESLIVAGDAAATAQNIRAAESLFRWGIAGDLLMILCDVALAVVFFVLLKPVDSGLSLLAAFFRLIQAAVLAANLMNLFLGLQLLSGAAYLTALDGEALQAQALFFLSAHATGYSLGLVFFGLNCLLFGYLVYCSGYLPRLLGALIVFAGVGYLTDSFAGFLLPSYAGYADIFALVVFLPAIVGELSMALWLLVKGVGRDRTAADDVLLPTGIHNAQTESI